eukprot:scaffold3815_cov355-Prasinococcus_capsulatus_cf.AAC.1
MGSLLPPPPSCAEPPARRARGRWGFFPSKPRTRRGRALYVQVPRAVEGGRQSSWDAGTCWRRW